MKRSSGDVLGVITQDGPSPDGDPGWRFVTNHARVLETIARDPAIRLRDVALIVGVTERTAAQIVDDFVRAGYITKTREGRRNRYEIHGELPLRHPHHRHRTVADLLRFLEAPPEGALSDAPPSAAHDLGG
jgi:Mn-dependent DtxR family transcriptional regulator